MNGEILGPSKIAALYTGIEPVVQLTIEARIYVNAMMRTSTLQELGLESRWWVQTEPACEGIHLGVAKDQLCPEPSRYDGRVDRCEELCAFVNEGGNAGIQHSSLTRGRVFFVFQIRLYKRSYPV